MTSLSIIFGLRPMIMIRGEASELFTMLGVTVFGRRVRPTFLTLLILAVVYSFADRVREKTRKLFERI